MFKASVLSYIFLLYSLNILGQDLIKAEKSNAITFAPLNLFDPVNPSLQFGYEKTFKEKWEFQIEGGWIINKSIENTIIDRSNDIPDSDYSNRGFKIRTELKRFFHSRTHFKMYYSFEFFYLRNNSFIQETFLIADTTFNYSTPRTPGSNTYTDHFYNNKEKIGLNLKFGIKFLLGQHFLLEPHCGIGIASRNNVQSGRVNPNDPVYDDFLGETPGRKWILSIPLNIKVGYRF